MRTLDDQPAARRGAESDTQMEIQAERVVRAAADGPGGGMHDVGAEAAAHALLRLVCDNPGQMGRLRAAKLVGGYRVAHRDEADAPRLARYAVQLDWTLGQIVDLVDALIGGGLMVQTAGPRPVLVLSRAGFHALEALEAGPHPQP